MAITCWNSETRGQFCSILVGPQQWTLGTDMKFHPVVKRRRKVVSNLLISIPGLCSKQCGKLTATGRPFLQQ